MTAVSGEVAGYSAFEQGRGNGAVAGTAAPDRTGWMIGEYMQTDKCKHLRNHEGEQRARTLVEQGNEST